MENKIGKEDSGKKCPFLDICGAGTIRDYRGESWHQRFCLADFLNCPHYEIRKNLKNHKQA